MGAFAAARTEDGSWDAMDSFYVTLQKGAPMGMLMAYYPSNGSTHALMDKMWFANGVVLAPDESYVLVADSLMAKIHKYICHWSCWLHRGEPGVAGHLVL